MKHKETHYRGSKVQERQLQQGTAKESTPTLASSKHMMQGNINGLTYNLNLVQHPWVP